MLAKRTTLRRVKSDILMVLWTSSVAAWSLDGRTGLVATGGLWTGLIGRQAGRKAGWRWRSEADNGRNGDRALSICHMAH